jgi:uncharacterized protein (DUF1697 family)
MRYCHTLSSKETSDVSRYVLLLRGVNVGTKNSLPMAELKKMLAELGGEHIETYVQSGNAIFDTKLSAKAVTHAIEAKLEQYMGRPIDTTLRTKAQMQAIVDGNPFVDVATEPQKLCVTFLSQAPNKAEVLPLLANDWAPELFHLGDAEIYSWHPNGQGRSPLAGALAKLPVRGTLTTRNWKTVTKLLTLL